MITTIACTQNGAPHPEEVNVEYTPKHINLIRPIVEPEKIYRMHLWNSRYNYLPEEMSKMRNLRRLALDNVEVKDWERSSKAISSFKNLEVLEIYSELPFLPFNPTNLKSLEKLNLMGSSGYNLEKAITKIEKLENLKVLFIGGLDVIEIPESILKLESLEELDIGYHNEALDYKAALNLISRLPNLKSLSIDMASLTSIDESFKNLRHLNKISFYDCEINLDEFYMLTKGWDNLEELVLEDMSMVRLPSSITQLQSLKSVSFYHNPDLDHASLFRQLAKLPHLEELDISETVDYQKDTLFHLPREIGMLKNLRKLEMENMYRVDYANLIEQIKDLPHLETLSLYNSNHYKKLLYDLKN